MTTFGRQPPANIQAEQSLLGALLANNKAYDRVVDFLRPVHFADARHGRLYEAIQRRVESGQLADPVTLRAEFENSGVLKEMGGAAYLAELLGALVGIINAGDYGKAIYDNYLRREFIEFGTAVVNRAYGVDGSPDGKAQILLAEEELYRLTQSDTGSNSRTVTLGEASEEALKMTERSWMSDSGLIGLTTGLRGIDRMTGGLKPGEFFVLAGRPSIGKTALGLRIAVGAAEAQAKVLFISAEMAASALSARLISAHAHMPMTAVLRGRVPDEMNPGRMRKLRQDEFDRLGESSAAMGRLPIRIDEAAKPGVAEIRSRARRLQRTKGLDLIVVDYLGKLRGSDATRGQNRTFEVSEVARDLKAMAVELGVPLLCLAQLSREVEKREDKSPIMSDLRDSGEIEQEADIIGLLYREHYYLRTGEPKRQPREAQDKFEARHSQWITDCLRSKGKADLIIGKQRQGPTGRVRLRFEDDRTWFSDPSDPDSSGPGSDGDE